MAEQLDATRVRALTASSPWPEPILVRSTGSTNADAARLAAEGAPEGACIAADEQTSGRGRLDRTWISPAGSGLWMSVVLRPGDQPRARWGWLPLAVGLAALDAIEDPAVRLKWPNDLVAATGKLGGVLLEADGDAVIAGIGINVTTSAGDLRELPNPATSLAAIGATTDREALLAAILSSLRRRLEQWRSADPQLVADYRAACSTIGAQVRVQLPEGREIPGVAIDVDGDGRLILDTGAEILKLAAGDVVHATM